MVFLYLAIALLCDSVLLTPYINGNDDSGFACYARFVRRIQRVQDVGLVMAIIGTGLLWKAFVADVPETRPDLWYQGIDNGSPSRSSQVVRTALLGVGMFVSGSLLCAYPLDITYAAYRYYYTLWQYAERLKAIRPVAGICGMIDVTKNMLYGWQHHFFSESNGVMPVTVGISNTKPSDEVTSASVGGADANWLEQQQSGVVSSNILQEARILKDNEHFYGVPASVADVPLSVYFPLVYVNSH